MPKKKSSCFEIITESQKSKARAGILHTPHGDILTPVFMPVGTQGTVKAVLPRDLKESGSEIILSNAYPVEVDKVGRVLVPQNLRQFLGIESGELTVAGQGDYFEVWTPAEWKAQMDKLQDVEANEQRFSTLDLSKSNNP